MKEQANALRRARFVEDAVRDVRQVERGLRKNPGFAVAVVLTLALGIGGNTAIFSVVDQLLLRPLPYPEGDQLLTISESFQGGPGGIGGNRNVASPANWLDWQREGRTLERVAAWRTVPGSVTLTARLLGVLSAARREAAPRANGDGSGRPSNAPRVVVLSHRLWQTRFGGDPAVIGSSWPSVPRRSASAWRSARSWDA